MAVAKNTSASAASVTTEAKPSQGIADFFKGSFKPAQLEKPEVPAALSEFINAAIGQPDLISDDAIATINNLIGELDRKLNEQMNLVLHHKDFQAVESTWRGLNTLVMNSELNDQLKVRVLNVSKEDLRKTFNRFSGERWNLSPLYKKIYQEEYGMPGGEPFGALIGDYQFSHDAPDVKVLTGMAQIAAASHAPFITAPSPALMKLDSWTEMPNLNDITKRFSLPEYAAWRSLRKSEDSKYIGLAFPRFLSRQPYGAKTNPVEEFDFEEAVAGADHEKFAWSNAAYAMGLNITKAFSNYGWTCAIRGVDSGGRVEGLPCPVFPTDDGGQDMKCPTEVNITQSLEQELANNGMMPLSHFKNTDYAAFVAAQSLHEPTEYVSKEATENARLGARLPYIFATTRFAHFLKKMVYRAVGKNMEREDVEKWLSNWIVQYVHPDPRNATDEARAERPLAEARVEVKAVEGDPGTYDAKFYLRPHFQLEALNVSLSLVAKLPASKK